MWSVGVLLYILITGQPPFDGKTIDELYENICKGEFLFQGREWDIYPEAKNLIFNLLQFEAQERFHAHEAVNHNFFNSKVDQPLIEPVSPLLPKSVKEAKSFQNLDLFERQTKLKDSIQAYCAFLASQK